MLSFTLSLVALLLGYLVYGRVVERIFGPDDRKTPAISMADGVDYVPMSRWKIFMIQFLNIAGTGPIFGAIMGAKFGPSAYLWIVFGCIFGGGVHDYMSGMLSSRHEGKGLPELVGKYLGRRTRLVSLFFTVLLLLFVGTVFVYSPAQLLTFYGGTMPMWIVAIFAYYLLATMLPIDKLIGKVYPLFAFALLFMAAALMVCLYIKMPDIPEVWNGLGNMGKAADSSFTDDIFPCLFITIACGALSGFHATQSPLMSRCIQREKWGRPVFYGAMITEGVVALVWAAVSSWFFYASPATGYSQLEAAVASGFHSSAPQVVQYVCTGWLGTLGGVLAVLGVVAAPITSGDTAFRSVRLILSDALHLPQSRKRQRVLVSLPIFAVAMGLLMWQCGNADGFNIIWQYFGWSNQTLSVFTLWMATAYLVHTRKCYWMTLIPALFMTCVCSTYFFVSPQMLHLSGTVGYPLGVLAMVVAAVWFGLWLHKRSGVEQ